MSACTPSIHVYLGLQDVKALIARVFRLQTEISRLKADVQKIGSARDTQELRQKVGQSGQRLKGDAQQISQDLQQAHKAKKTQQTTKIVADFEVPLKCVLAASWEQDGLSAQTCAAATRVTSLLLMSKYQQKGSCTWVLCSQR